MKKTVALILVAALNLNAFPKAYAQEKAIKPTEVFEKVELLTLNGKKAEKLPVRLRLEGKSLIVESKKSGEVVKTFGYSEIKSAEYSYSRHPRWKAGLGTVGAGSVAGAGLGAIGAGGLGAAYGLLIFFPIMVPVGLGLAASKSKRHWLTIKTGDDYIVLRLDKDISKLVIPAIETRTGLVVEDVGEKK